MNHHPECRKNEIYVGNTNKLNSHLDLVSAGVKFRTGKQAYYFDGGKITHRSDLAPLFIEKESAQRFDNLMKSQLKAIRSGKEDV